MFLADFGLLHPGKLGWWIAPTYALAEIAKEIFLQSVPRELIARVKRFEITLINGFRIQYRSAERPENLVGDKLVIVVFDEAGYMEGRLFDDFVRPTLSDLKGRAVFIGSPRGKSTAFYRWFLKGLDPEEPDWKSFQFPTWYNPHIDREEIRKAALEIPREMYRQNFGACWLDSFATVFSGVLNVARPMLRGHPRLSSWYITAADLGKYHDYTVAVTYDAATRMPVYLARWKKADWVWTLNRIANQAKRFPGQLWIDATGLGDPVYDFMACDQGLNVMPYKLSNDSKRVLIQQYQIAIETQKIYLPCDGRHGEVYISEHLAFELDVSKHGRILYSAPETQHDDCVIAGGIANYALMGSPVSTEGMFMVGS